MVRTTAGTAYPFQKLIDDTYETIHKLHSRTELVTGYPTGFVELDCMTGELHPGELIVIASRRHGEH